MQCYVSHFSKGQSINGKLVNAGELPSHLRSRVSPADGPSQWPPPSQRRPAAPRLPGQAPGGWACRGVQGSRGEQGAGGPLALRAVHLLRHGHEPVRQAARCVGGVRGACMCVAGRWAAGAETCLVPWCVAARAPQRGVQSSHDGTTTPWPAWHESTNPFAVPLPPPPPPSRSLLLSILLLLLGPPTSSPPPLPARSVQPRRASRCLRWCSCGR